MTAGKTHRELYPEQYTHPLVGQRVTVRQGRIVERVVPTKWGPLAVLQNDLTTAYQLSDVEVTPLPVGPPCNITGCPEPATHHCGCGPVYCYPHGLEQGCGLEVLPPLPLGTRVRLRHDVDRYPHFRARAGMTGTVVTVGPDPVVVRMDEYLEGCEEWDNAILWSNDDDPMDDLEVVNDSESGGPAA